MRLIILQMLSSPSLDAVAAGLEPAERDRIDEFSAAEDAAGYPYYSRSGRSDRYHQDSFDEPAIDASHLSVIGSPAHRPFAGGAVLPRGSLIDRAV